MRTTLLALVFALPGMLGPELQDSPAPTQEQAAQEPAPTPAPELLDSWPRWHGPLDTGVAPRADPPLTWSEREHVRWKVSLPGKGHSSPIVWGESVFVTTAVPTGEAFAPRRDDVPGVHDDIPVTHRHAFLVLALQRADGAVAWSRQLAEAVPHEGGHYTGSYASASPVTDGRRLIVSFGSHGIFGLDLDGNVLWEKDLGDMQTKHAHGEGSSPALHGSTVVVTWDHEGGSFVVALDADTGEERWRAARDEPTSWATPIFVEHAGRTQVVVSGTERVRGYDSKSGAVIWECGGLSSNVVASPVAGDGFVFAGSSYEHQALLAIRLDGARGDVTDRENLVWYRRRATPYVPSPLLFDGWLYFLHHYQGFLSRVEARTGAEPERATRLEGLDDVYASPLGAAGRIYVTDRSGVTLVLSAEPVPRILARNVLEESFSATAAAVGTELYLRGEHSLYCLSR